MKHSQEEILNALQVIKDTCEEMPEFDPCEHCPLSKNGNCILQEREPSIWAINPRTSVWKAFE